MMKKIILIFSFLIISVIGFCQTGIINGKVIDAKTKETLVGVSVWIEGTTIGALTDLNGEFEINSVKVGSYTVMASYISYAKMRFENVKVSKDHINRIDVELAEDVMTMDEVVVVDRRITNTEISIINSIKNTNLVANGVSSQLITKSQDRDASEVIRRIPGITIFNGRFVIVRGLNQRYNSVFLNNASTPSSEADTRAFSFDIIPSSLLENIMVYKTPAPHLPADFSGAFIEITTKNTPQNNSLDVSYNASFNENTTFNDFYKYKGGSFDFVGLDDGTRALPDKFPSTDEYKTLSNSYTQEDINKVEKFGESINRTWTAQSKQAFFDNRLNVTAANKFALGKVEVGTINSLNYANTFVSMPIHRMDYQVYNFEEDKPSLNFDFKDIQYTNNLKTGILSNWSFNLNPGNKIVFNNLFNQIGYTRTTFREGYEYYSSQQIKSYEYSFMSRTTYSGQVNGEHTNLKTSSKLSWTVGYSFANRNEPNQKRLTSILNTTVSDPYFNQYAMAIGNTASPKYAGIVDQKLIEHIGMFKLDYTHPFQIKAFMPELRVGMLGEYKKRQFDARLLGFVKSNENLFDQDLLYQGADVVFNNENINSTTGIKLTETTNLSDSYDANNLQISGYFSVKLPVSEWMTIFTGLRVEENKQQLNSFSSDLSTVPVHYVNDGFGLFPSINLTLDLTSKSLIRLSYGRTTNRPEFREIAPFNFYVFQENASFIGNTALKNAFIRNFDARFELYPSLSDMFTIGVFYKDFLNPIEISYVNSGSGLAYGPINASGAKSYGAEIELRQSFSTLSNIEFIQRWLKNVSVVFNASVIKSKVKFPTGAIERDRYMQGQSPYIVNTGLYYQTEKSRWSGSLLYNILGKRIVVVGQANQNQEEDIPDVYEMPFNSLDFAISKKFGNHIQLKGGVQNLLNGQVLYQQTVKFNKPNEGEITRKQPTLSYHPGRYYTLGISFTM
ncbi:MAG: TonB-dependent receptor [Bacteroidales bacterium]|nr:TonB-dependent receptor [Bacteroidales bacterium]